MNIFVYFSIACVVLAYKEVKINFSLLAMLLTCMATTLGTCRSGSIEHGLQEMGFLWTKV